MSDSNRIVLPLLDDEATRAVRAAMESGVYNGRRVLGLEYDVAAQEPTVTIRLEPIG